MSYLERVLPNIKIKTIDLALVLALQVMVR
jgi:hypothetical protein